MDLSRQPCKGHSVTEGLTAPDMGDSTTARQEWMGLLARAPAAALAAALENVTLPDYRLMRAPQTGLVMLKTHLAMGLIQQNLKVCFEQRGKCCFDL